jgi:hypothetical protein
MLGFKCRLRGRQNILPLFGNHPAERDGDSEMAEVIFDTLVID